MRPASLPARSRRAYARSALRALGPARAASRRTHPGPGARVSRFLYRAAQGPLAPRRAPSAAKDRSVENIGLEPMASCLQSRRSTS